jgi:hypothetical protein
MRRPKAGSARLKTLADLVSTPAVLHARQGKMEEGRSLIQPPERTDEQPG